MPSEKQKQQERLPFEDERCCNTCSHYDPEEGICLMDRLPKRSFEGEDCDEWRDWEHDW